MIEECYARRSKNVATWVMLCLTSGGEQVQDGKVPMHQHNFLWGCLRHGPWSRPLPFQNMWLVVELVSNSLWFASRRKNQSDHGVLRSPKGLFSLLHYPLSWSNGFCSTKRGKRGSLAVKVKEPQQRNFVFTFYHFLGNIVVIKRIEQRKKGDGKNTEKPKIAISEHIEQKSNISIFLAHGHSSWSMFDLQLTSVQSLSNLHFCHKFDHGSVIMEKSHLTLGQLSGPWCKQPLSGYPILINFQQLHSTPKRSLFVG